MATAQDTTGSTEAAIIARMIHPEKADLPNDTAQAVLRLLSLDQTDLDRMHVLAVRNQDDALTPDEKAELESYLRISMMVDLIHAKARLSLRKHR
jgi:cyanate lyase